MSIIVKTIYDDDSDDNYNEDLCISDIIFDSTWKLNACLKHNCNPTFNKKNKKITLFLNKHFHNETWFHALGVKKILDDNETIMAYESTLDRVFCRIDTPYRENIQIKYNVYRYNINGKDMISYFVTIYTSINEDKKKLNQCSLVVKEENIDLERALILLPTFREQFTRNQTI